jgi:hypothetical protein
MVPGLVLSETLLAGLSILLLAVLQYALAISTRPDPKMLFLLSLLETLPRDDEQAEAKEKERSQ